jgi:hypothetical protein
MPEGVAELCMVYKTADHGFGAALVIDSLPAKKLLCAYALFPLPPWRRPRSRMPEDGRERWMWLWSGFDGGPTAPTFLDGLASAAGISVEAAYRVWPSLMISRVIYPDGTLSDHGQALLQAHVVGRLPKPPPASRQPASPKKGPLSDG